MVLEICVGGVCKLSLIPTSEGLGEPPHGNEFSELAGRQFDELNCALGLAYTCRWVYFFERAVHEVETKLPGDEIWTLAVITRRGILVQKKLSAFCTSVL